MTNGADGFTLAGAQANENASLCCTVVEGTPTGCPPDYSLMLGPLSLA